MAAQNVKAFAEANKWLEVLKNRCLLPMSKNGTRVCFMLKTFAEAVLEDCKGIHRLNCDEMNYDFPFEETKQQLEKILKSPKDKVFVAVLNDQVIGYVHANDYDVIYGPPMKNVVGIAVSKDYKKEGLGGRCFQKLRNGLWNPTSNRYDLSQALNESRPIGFMNTVVSFHSSSR